MQQGVVNLNARRRERDGRLKRRARYASQECVPEEMRNSRIGEPMSRKAS